MERKYYENRLKEVLPYADTWYEKLSDKQVFTIYYKYLIGNIPLPRTVINIEIEEKPKVLSKRRVHNGENQILTDSGRWELEWD